MLTQVVDTLKQLGDAPKPFSQSKQYKRNVKNSKASKAEDPDAAELAEAPSKGSSAKEKAKKKRPDVSKVKKSKSPPPVSETDGTKIDVYQPNEYSRIKRDFINSVKESKGLTSSEAAKLWDSGPTKKRLLGTLSVSELIRRRFIEKGSQSNPWADDA